LFYHVISRDIKNPWLYLSWTQAKRKLISLEYIASLFNDHSSQLQKDRHRIETHETELATEMKGLSFLGKLNKMKTVN